MKKNDGIFSEVLGFQCHEGIRIFAVYFSHTEMRLDEIRDTVDVGNPAGVRMTTSHHVQNCTNNLKKSRHSSSAHESSRT